MTLTPSSYTKHSPQPCPGCPVGSNLRVGGRGNVAADLVIVGEAPGSEELRSGVPFVGPNGEVLTRALPKGFDIDKQAFVLNAMQCRPRKTASQHKDKQFKHACTQACRDRLATQLWEHPRKVILCLGNWAAEGVTGQQDFKITQRRGEVEEVQDPIRDVPVRVVYVLHPAYLLRGGGSIKGFAADICKGIELAYGERVAYGEGAREVKVWVPPTYKILETPAMIHKLCDHVLAQGRSVTLAADYETTGLNRFVDKPLSLGVYGDWDDNRALMMPWRLMQRLEYRKAYVRLRTLRNVKWLWQFGKFDNSFDIIHSVGVPREFVRVDEDTLLLSYALNEASKAHDLEEQAKNWLGAPAYKDFWRPYLPNKKASWALIPEEVLLDYQAKDLKNTMGVWKITRELVRKDPHLEKLYTQTLLPMSKLCLDIEMQGMYVDWDYVRINREGTSAEDVANGFSPEKGLEQEVDELEEQLNTLAGWIVNANSYEQVASLLYDQFGLRIKGKRPLDTRKETLDKLPPHPAAKKIRMIRRLRKMLSTYVTAIENRAVNNRVHSTYKPHGTTTGRPSATEPNILNIPREGRFRRMYRARPGYVLIEGDYNTAELRMLAVLSEDAFLMGVFLDDTRNLHDEVSVEMYGVNFDGDQRIRAKAINFGIPYGRKAYSVAEEFDITVSEAQRIIDVWFARAPGAEKFLDKCRAAPLQGRTLITVFGRKRRPGMVSYDRIDGLQNEFANFYMQSTVNDFTIHSAIRMQPEIEAEGAHLVNTIYDANLVECPDHPAKIRKVSAIMKYHMEETPKLWIETPVVFRVDLKVGVHWGLLEKYPPKGVDVVRHLKAVA